MKKHLKVFILVFISITCFETTAQNETRNFLNQYSNQLSEIIIPVKNWHPFPTINERNKWDHLSAETKKSLKEEGDKYLNYKWPVIPAATALDFSRNGNRTRYESISFGRRNALKALLFAELADNKGKYLDDISNGIWAICEETFWGASAHLSAQSAGKGLPDVTEPIVELFAAETSALLAWTYYLLDDKLESISPLIRPRIKYEIQRRIFTPYLSTNSSWMGFNKKPNNWNPWINSNVLMTVLFIQDDTAERAKLVKRILLTLDNFINPYPNDGGCDEGPSYWSVAGGRLFTCLEYLDKCTAGKINIYDKQLIKNIAAYYYKMHISKNYFINTGDGAAKLNPDPILLYSIGKSTGDKNMMSLASFFHKEADAKNDEEEYFKSPVHLMLVKLFAGEEIESYSSEEPLLRDFWLPESQYMGARSKENSSKGLYFAMQGGHNSESHNHNDVGNFVIFADGSPAIIDIGVETYTAKTFSPQRYDIWTMQSAYHNLPTINGVMQKDGAKYKATDLNYSSSDAFAQLSMNIAAAYPEEAKVKSWNRTLRLNRNVNIELTENYELNDSKQANSLNFITCLDAKIDKEGTIILEPTKDFPHTKLFIEYDKNQVSVEFEKIKVEDPKLQHVWKKSLTRIVLTCLSQKLKDEIKITFRQ